MVKNFKICSNVFPGFRGLVSINFRMLVFSITLPWFLVVFPFLLLTYSFLNPFVSPLIPIYVNIQICWMIWKILKLLKAWWKTGICYPVNVKFQKNHVLPCLTLNPLNVGVALIYTPANWFAMQINWLVSTWGQHWHLMG